MYCSLMRDDKRFGVAQFMRDSILMRDAADKNSGCYTVLSRDELNCIVNYLATIIIFSFSIFVFFVPRVRRVRFDYK